MEVAKSVLDVEPRSTHLLVYSGILERHSDQDRGNDLEVG